MGEYRAEVHRDTEVVELIEQLDVDYKITENSYNSQHDLSGKIRATVAPDKQTVRSRRHPPVNILTAVAQKATGTNFVLNTSYPGTEFILGITQSLKGVQGETEYQENIRRQPFSVEGIPTNGTVELTGDWETDHAQKALEDDKSKFIEHEYDVDAFPSEQLPMIIRAKLHRDTREYLEEMQQRKNIEVDPSAYEGTAILAVTIEYPESTREAERTDTTMQLDLVEGKLSSTFNQIEFFADTTKRGDYTYNPEDKKIKWRNERIRQGESVRYEIVGPIGELLDVENISMRVRGTLRGATLTGTRIESVFDKTGEKTSIPVDHNVRITGRIQLDPDSLAGESRKVTKASISVEETPTATFDRLEEVCRREAMTIKEVEPPKNPEPVPGRESVFQITASDSGRGDDQPGRLEVKREFGNEGVVYVEMEVTGEFTAVREETEISAVDQSTDRMKRSDEGALGDRGKSTVELTARSAKSELNSKLINLIKKHIGGGAERERRQNNTMATETEKLPTDDRSPELEDGE